MGCSTCRCSPFSFFDEEKKNLDATYIVKCKVFGIRTFAALSAALGRHVGRPLSGVWATAEETYTAMKKLKAES